MKIKFVDVSFEDKGMMGASGSNSNGSGNTNGDTSNAGNMGKDKDVIVTGEGGEIVATLPPGFTRIYGGGRMLAIADDGRLMVLSGENLSSRNIVGQWDTSSSGELRDVVAHGDVLTLVGSKRIAWIVVQSDGSYSYRTTLPAAPACNVRMTQVPLSPYNETDEGCVAFTVYVPVGESRVGHDAMYLWLEDNDATGVDEDIREMIYRAVGEGVEEYLAAVAQAGMMTAPAMAYTALSGRMPGAITMTGEYERPALWIESWRYSLGVLHLRLRLSAVPVRLSADIEVTAGNVIWSDIFKRMEVYVSESVDWWRRSPESGVTIYGLGTVMYDGQRRRGFQMYAMTAEAYDIALRGKRGFKIGGSVSTSTAVDGYISLCRETSAPDMYPDYSDHERLRASGGVATAEGPVLFVGNTVLTALPEFPVLYPSRKVICDAEIIALSESFRSRSATLSGRTPLLAFCRDGVRLISASGDGGYGLTQLLSRDVIRGRDTLAVTTTSVVYLTVRGLIQLSGSKRAELSTELLINDMSRVSIRYSYKNDFIVIRDGETGYVYELAGERTGPLDVAVSDIVEYDNRVFGVDEHRHLLELRLVKRQPADMGSTDPSGDREGSEDSDEENTDQSVVRTLDLGDKMARKRIRRLTIPHREIEWQLEGADWENEWRPVCQGDKGMSGRLRLPAFRFWRLRLKGQGASEIAAARLEVEVDD